MEDGRVLLSAHGVTIPNNLFVSSSITDVGNRRKSGKHTYFYQPKGMKLLVGFNSAMSEGLQLYSWILDIDNSKLRPESDFFNKKNSG
jgi:hypothetical protein